MIKSFTVKNFKSILDLTLDFSYSEGKAPNGYEEMETLPFLEIKRTIKENKQIKNEYKTITKKEVIRTVPCLVMYGANAAGKSNIIQALSVMNNVIDEGIANTYKPNKLNKKYDYTVFIVEICIDKKIYKYELKYNNNAILEEILSVDNNIVYSINKELLDVENITTETYNTKKINEIYQVECCNTDKLQQKTFLNVMYKNYAGLNKYVNNFVQYIHNNLYILMHTEFPVGLGVQIFEKSCKIDRQIAFQEIVDILKKFDFDITNIKLEEELINESAQDGLDSIKKIGGEFFIRDNKLYSNKIFSYHKDIDKNEVKFDFRNEESLGTNTLASILGPILMALHTGSVLCIDELERSIHPLVLREIIKMFKSKRYNKNNAQLVFTAHNTDILDDEILRVSEIAFTSKKIETGTVIRKASSFKGIRNVNNFRKKYLHGEFAAIPYPYI